MLFYDPDTAALDAFTGTPSAPVFFFSRHDDITRSTVWRTRRISRLAKRFPSFRFQLSLSLSLVLLPFPP